MQVLANQSIFRVIPGTAAEWATATFSNNTGDAKYMPPDVILFETDTRKIKVSDSTTSTYTALPYIADVVFTSQFKTIIDNAEQANGALVLNDSGIIDGQYIPAYIANKPIIVADITARNAIPEDNRTGIVVVRNATGDATVGMSNGNAATRLLLHFDGNMNDSSAYKNTAVIAYGTPAFDSNPKFGSSALTGNTCVTAYNITAIPAHSAFTVEFMYRKPAGQSTFTGTELLTEFSNRQGHINPTTGTITHFVGRVTIAYDTSNVLLQNGAGSVVLDTVNINDGVFHRIGVRSTGALMSLYVDNRLVGAVSNGQANLGPIDLVSIGGSITNASISSGNYTSMQSTLRGTIDEYRIINYDKFATDTSIPTAPFAVNDNAASYVWNTADSVWVKIGEYESMDVDFSDFVKQGDAVSRLTDGTTYKQFTITERTQLSQLITDLSAVSGNESANYGVISGRFNNTESRQTAIGSRLGAVETTTTHINEHAILDTDDVVFVSVSAAQFM